MTERSGINFESKCTSAVAASYTRELSNNDCKPAAAGEGCMYRTALRDCQAAERDQEMVASCKGCLPYP